MFLSLDLKQNKKKIGRFIHQIFFASNLIFKLRKLEDASNFSDIRILLVSTITEHRKNYMLYLW